MRPRSCPHCSAVLGTDEGFRFDDDYNVICLSCGKVAVPITWQGEQEVDAAVRARQPANTGTNWNDRYSNQPTGGTKTYPPNYAHAPVGPPNRYGHSLSEAGHEY